MMVLLNRKYMLFTFPLSVMASILMSLFVLSDSGYRCSLCAPGKFAQDTGTATCALCDAGKVTVNPGSDVCTG